jgi:hypothetical protein
VSSGLSPDQMLEAKYSAQMQGVAEALDSVFNGNVKSPNKKVGFVLLLFEYGTHDGRANYISNGADRKDIVNLFKEMIARFEGQPEMTGRG